MTEELEGVLMQLADESRPVRSIDIFPLSDLTRERLARFTATWHVLSAARRLELIGEMVEQAETNIHFNFHATLRTLLRDPDGRVRRLAVEGLWEDEKTNLISPLVDLLHDDPEVEVRATAAISLGRFILLGALGDIREEPALSAELALRETWFRTSEVNEVRRRALESLAYGSTEGLSEMIRSAYYHEDAGVRQSAVFAMGRTTDVRWSRLVLEELTSYEPAMRFEAAQAAGEMDLKAAVQPLIQCLDDADASVRAAAVEALGKIGGPVAKRALQTLRQVEDEVLVQAAEDALDELNFASEAASDVHLEFKNGGSARGAASDDPDGFDDLDQDDVDVDADDLGFGSGFDDQEGDDDLDWEEDADDVAAAADDDHDDDDDDEGDDD